MVHIIEAIESYARFGSKLGLERMEAILDKLGNPHKGLKVIHVAGTNGKGSVCKYLYEILQAAGYRTGLYISPFLEVFNERIQFNGQNISDQELTLYGNRVFQAIEEMEQAGMEPPTEFELITAIAFAYFGEKNPDFVILEVGLGGDGDSTNVVEKPLVSIITSIAHDHMDRLGGTLEAIATSKAGIIKKGCPVVVHCDHPGAAAVLKKRAQEMEAPYYDLTQATIQDLRITPEGTFFSAAGADWQWPDVQVGMIGRHQADNSVLALAAIELLTQKGIMKSDTKAVKAGLLKARQPGRFEIFAGKDCKGGRFILDGAHNREGMESLLRTMKELFPQERVLVVTGILADKEVDRMVGILEEITDDFLVVPVPNPRAMAPEELCALFNSHGKNSLCASSPQQGVVMAAEKLRQKEYDICLFAGSLYLIGEIRSVLRHEEYIEEA